MKGTFTSLGTTTTDDTVPKSLDVGDWYYAGYDGTTLLASKTVNYLTSNNRTQSNGVTTVNNGSGVNAPLFFVRSGHVDGGSFANSGSHGYYWSSALYDRSNAYRFNFFATSIDTSNVVSARSYGRTVRCVAR